MNRNKSVVIKEIYENSKYNGVIGQGDFFNMFINIV